MFYQKSALVDKNQKDLFEIHQEAQANVKIGQPMMQSDGKKIQQGTKLLKNVPGKELVYTWKLGSTTHLVVETPTKFYKIYLDPTMLRLLKSV